MIEPGMGHDLPEAFDSNSRRGYRRPLQAGRPQCRMAPFTNAMVASSQPTSKKLFSKSSELGSRPEAMIVNSCFFIVGLLVATLIYQRTRSRRSPCTIVTVRRCFPRSGCAEPSAPAAATVTRVIACHFFSNVRHFFCSARDSGTGTRASFSTVDIGTAFASTGSGGEGAASAQAPPRAGSASGFR